ncbi:MAG: LacI family transcriptional regulator [Fimbriimonadales bacterium]|nr:LacI family transcriptional regulator [Fimbriimonadales bacterium]
MATLKDVAKASGVSTATVSHVLHGRWDRVSDATRAKVMRAIRQLNYRPSPYRTRKGVPPSKNLAFICEELEPSPILSNNYFAKLLDGFFEAAWRLGYSVTVDVERVSLDGVQKVRHAFDGRCDGVALMAPCLDSLLLNQLVERGVPVVVIGSASQGKKVSTVDVDNIACGRMAADHLSRLGHERLAYVGRVADKSSSLERLEGVRAYCRDFGLPDPIVVDGVFARESGREMADWLLRLPAEELPTGWICSNDEIAYGVAERLAAAGVRVPEDVSLVGTDDTVIAQMARPPLTTLRQPLQEMGAEAARILAERATCRESPEAHTVFSVQLIQRQSTAPPRSAPVKAGRTMT